MSRLVLLVLVICATAMFATSGGQFLHGLGGEGLLGSVGKRLTSFLNRPEETSVNADTATSEHRPTLELIEVAFAPRPQDAALRLVIRAIDSGARTIDVAAYEFTSKPVADALIRAVQRGVISLVADAQENPGSGGESRVGYVAAAGVAVRLDDVYPIMHNKFIVIDGETVQTGSFNYTFAAQRRNAENAMVLWHAPLLAGRYAEDFAELWAESRPID
ncbi:PLD-like domain-containing protein [Rhizobiales bacterium GAS191]|nr:PLD-like domain-containing protein [Rhizobiales bacterium GAS191]